MSTVLTPYLKKLVSNSEEFVASDLTAAFSHIIDGSASELQIGAFLTALRMKGLDHSSHIIAAAASVLRGAATTIDSDKVSKAGYVDIVGTGGDGQNTFNVSTTSAIVAAGMGLHICKHGGKASTSSSGAGDLLTSLGIDMANVNAENVPHIITQSNFCFLFAPVFHPVMAKLAPLRKGLGIPTIFNILGPLINPAPLKARIIGVYAKELGLVFAEAVRELDMAQGRSDAQALVVWGNEGLDEISPTGNTTVWRLKGGNIDTFTLHPSDFGLPTHPLSECGSGTPNENAVIVKKLVNNELEDGHPILDYVLMNAAALAVVEGTAGNWKEGVELARKSISGGAAKKALEDFTKASNEKY
ncbi:putative anthranilate phosphoribosyl transferase [Nadsonia fulvescens var. elongata DSM 6958]|uniref:Anthranilate phosphoribosyltransferase n=1 Tax=Nadsonia fulvescens var. elongata DSM 6958 TaxID=857566 RepID=A0A1E3PIG9_9ASCO|nr:putative anthranilate phosphoribosyl transferase [Nadsonia fulvescens var. elongata DSM 6958]